MEWPKVSVVVLNYNGKQHLADCLSSLLELDYPTEKLELLLVDNASADDSVAFVRQNFPRVRVVQNPDNLGFAAGNNRGAEAATGEYVALLNNDTRVDPQWVKELVRPCLEEEDVVCTASKMLSWDGKMVDFACSAMNFHAFAFQPDHGLPDTFHERIPLLFACGGAMLIRRDVFLDVGGFDEDYFIYFEDMDLGWRLWIEGYRVLFSPAAVVYHRLHATMDAFTGFRKWVLFERNALMTLLKNYADDDLHKMLSASLLLMFRRSGRLMQEHGWDVRPYYIRNSQAADLHENVSRAGLSVLVAANEVIDQLPRIFEKRAQIQARRKRSDSEVFQHFALPLFVHPILHRDAQAHYDVVHYLGVSQLFRDVPRRVLLVSQRNQSALGSVAPHSGIGFSSIGDSLAAAGHSVFYGFKGDDGSASPAAENSRQRVYQWGRTGLNSLVNSINPELIIALDSEVLAELGNCPVPLVFVPLGDDDFPTAQARGELVGERNSIDLRLDSRENVADTGRVDDTRRLLLDPNGLDELEQFCRMPRKFQRQGYESTTQEAGAGDSAFSAPPPPKSLRQLAQEAALHFRQRGAKGFLYEFFGFLQKQVERRL